MGCASQKEQHVQSQSHERLSQVQRGKKYCVTECRQGWRKVVRDASAGGSHHKEPCMLGYDIGFPWESKPSDILRK